VKCDHGFHRGLPCRKNYEAEFRANRSGVNSRR
jgi:hypothetical protein